MIMFNFNKQTIWEIEFIDGKKINETIIYFGDVEKDKIKSFYFVDKDKNRCGFFYSNKVFFINNQLFDFKLDIDILSVFQYKNASYNVQLNVSKINSWNIGFIGVGKNGKEKYTMSIFENGNILLLANRYIDTLMQQEKILKLK